LNGDNAILAGYTINSSATRDRSHRLLQLTADLTYECAGLCFLIVPKAAITRRRAEGESPWYINQEKIGPEAIKHLQERYQVEPIDLEAAVYYRLTDNWNELAVRFLAPGHGVRQIKNQMSHEILTEFEKARLGIASGTYAIVQVPPIEIKGLHLRNQPPA
jgi:hypothetical protein